MEDLIEALTLFKKYLEYPNEHSPVYCDHETLYIMGVDEKDVNEEDMKRLIELGFFVNEAEGGFMSFRYG